MLFSFVIPTYNRAHKVKRAIESITEQPLWDTYCEIIVVDDGSTDDTATNIAPYLKSEQISYIKHDTNKGVAKAKNTGILNAENKFVVLLDSDDLLDVNGLSYLKSLVLKHDNDLFFVGTKVLNNLKLLYDPEFIGVKSYYDLIKTPVGEYLPICRTTVLQQNLLQNLRGYEGITWLNIAKKGFSVYYDNQPIRLYDDSGNDRISNRLNYIKNSLKMKDGYSIYLKEFGEDLKSLNYPKYLEINFKWTCYYLMSFSFLKFAKS